MTNQPQRGQSPRPIPPSTAPSPQPPLQPMQTSHGIINGAVRFIATAGLGGMLMFGAAVIGEVAAPEGYRPSELLGNFYGTVSGNAAEAQQEAQANLERAVAQARTEGERAAEIAYQERLKQVEYDYNAQLQLFQGQVQSSVAAYQNLYDRATQLQHIAMGLEGYVMQQRAQTMRDTQTGRIVATNVFDVLCLFDRQSCRQAEDLRYQLIDEVNVASQTGYGTILANTMTGIPDPATLKAQLGNPEL